MLHWVKTVHFKENDVSQDAVKEGWYAPVPAVLIQRLAAYLYATTLESQQLLKHPYFTEVAREMGYSADRREHFGKFLAKESAFAKENNTLVNFEKNIARYLRKYPRHIRAKL